jgi:hypothetical protein
MKKLLCGFLGVAASAAFAVDSEVATVDVTAISSTLTNTVVAISVLDLSGGNLAISNIVKTTNLKAGDKLYAFDNGTYECWTLSADGDKGGVWEKSYNYTKNSEGNLEASEGSEASAVRMAVGKGIWLHREDPTSSNPFYVYGAHATEKSVTISATSLLGNPTQSPASPTITGCAVGDQIAVPQAGTLERYTYTAHPDGKTGNVWWHGTYRNATPPSIVAGTGFWYIYPAGSASHSVTVSW